MGRYMFHCRKCKYGLPVRFGSCVLHPGDYAKVLTEVRRGVYGASPMKALKETPMGILDCDWVLLQCPECRHLFMEPNLSVYGPKKPVQVTGKRKWPVDYPGSGFTYAPPWRFSGYTLAHRVEHTCPRCNAVANIIEEDDLGEWECQHDYDREPTDIPCPRCRRPLWMSGRSEWEDEEEWEEEDEDEREDDEGTEL